MPELNLQEILRKVRETKETLERATEELDTTKLELDDARRHAAEAAQGRADAERQLAEKEQAIQDLLMQNLELQEKVTQAEEAAAAARAEGEEKSRLLEELNELLA